MSSAHLFLSIPVSSALEFGRHEQKRERLRAAFGAQDGLARFARSERRQRLLEHLARIGLRAHAARELIGDVEALRQAVEPGRALVGEPLPGTWKTPPKSR